MELEDGRARGAYGSGELLHGRVRLELRGALRLRALEVCARGRAFVHWLESHSVGLNTVYHDYMDFQTFLYRRCQLIPGKAGARGWFCAKRCWVGTPVGCRHPLWAVLHPSREGRCHLQAAASLSASAKGFFAAGFGGTGEHKRVVAFVLFAQGSANRSVCSQAWKEHLVAQ